MSCPSVRTRAALVVERGRVGRDVQAGVFLPYGTVEAERGSRLARPAQTMLPSSSDWHAVGYSS